MRHYSICAAIVITAFLFATTAWAQVSETFTDQIISYTTPPDTTPNPPGSPPFTFAPGTTVVFQWTATVQGLDPLMILARAGLPPAGLPLLYLLPQEFDFSGAGVPQPEEFFVNWDLTDAALQQASGSFAATLDSPGEYTLNSFVNPLAACYDYSGGCQVIVSVGGLSGQGPSISFDIAQPAPGPIPGAGLLSYIALGLLGIGRMGGTGCGRPPVDQPHDCSARLNYARREPRNRRPFWLPRYLNFHHAVALLLWRLALPRDSTSITQRLCALWLTPRRPSSRPELMRSNV
jgi:hypothetical protein